MIESCRVRFRSDIPDREIAWGMHVYKDRDQLAWCAPLLREHYPTARVVVIADGDGERYEDLAERYGLDLVIGEHLYHRDTGHAFVNRMLTHLLSGSESYLFKIDPDTRIWRRFRQLPAMTAVFGTFETLSEGGRSEIQTPANIQGGCVGMTRDAAAAILASQVLNYQSCAVDYARTWARFPEALHFAQHGGLLEDCIFSWGAYQCGIPFVESPEIRSRWRMTPPNPDLRFAVTHPHKVAKRVPPS